MKKSKCEQFVDAIKVGQHVKSNQETEKSKEI